MPIIPIAYAVTTGQYDEYEVHGVYTTKEKALEAQKWFSNKYEQAKIEEIPLDYISRELSNYNKPELFYKVMLKNVEDDNPLVYEFYGSNTRYYKAEDGESIYPIYRKGQIGITMIILKMRAETKERAIELARIELNKKLSE